MRRVTLLFLSMLLLAGCSPSGRSAPAPAPLDWYLKNGMEPPPLGSCPFPAVQGEPVLAGVQAFGLDMQGWWRPGYASKVNWVAPDRTQMDLTLTSVGTEQRQTFVLSMDDGPSLMQFPGPGCWELTLKAGDQTSQLFMPIRADRPAYLGALPDGPRSAAPLLTANKDLEALLKVIASGKEGPKPEKERTSSWLTLVWEHTGYSPLRYYPSSPGNTALLQVPESLVTGSCHDGGEVFRVVPPTLSKTIEHDLATMVLVAGDEGGMTGGSGSCSTFRNKAAFAMNKGQ